MSDGLYDQIIQELESSKENILPAEVVMFSEPLRSTLDFALDHKRFNLSEFTEQLKFTREQSRRIAELLTERNFLNILTSPYEEEPQYETRFSK